MAVIWRGSLARGQLHFQEIRSRGGDSLTTELHFSFPEKKSLQMHSKTLPHPKTRRSGGAHGSAAQLRTSRGQAVQMQRGKHRNTGGQWLCFLLSYFARFHDTRTEYGKLHIKHACVHAGWHPVVSPG